MAIYQTPVAAPSYADAVATFSLVPPSIQVQQAVAIAAVITERRPFTSIRRASGRAWSEPITVHFD